MRLHIVLEEGTRDLRYWEAAYATVRTTSKGQGGYLTIEQLRGLAEAHDEEDFFFQIQECMEQGLLSPVKQSATNGNLRFPLRMKYRITHAKAADNDALYEIRALHSALQRDGFLLKHPEQYRNYRCK